ncbi:hypothetical protein QYM36_013896, partial [Artemia franciscana]
YTSSLPIDSVQILGSHKCYMKNGVSPKVAEQAVFIANTARPKKELQARTNDLVLAWNEYPTYMQAH